MLQQCKINRWHTKPALCAWLALTLHTHLAAHVLTVSMEKSIFIRAMKFYALRANCFMMAIMRYSENCSENPLHEKLALSTSCISSRARNLG